MTTLLNIPFTLDIERLLEEQHITPGTNSAKTFQELAAKVQEVGRPKAVYDVAVVEEKGEDTVVLNGVRFRSRSLRTNLDAIERVFPHVATCGTEADALASPSGDALEEHWLWAIKQELLKAAVAHLLDHLRATYRLPSLSVIEPGSGDATMWPLAQQRDLFSLLGDVRESIGVWLTTSLLMVPTVSCSGIAFHGEIEFTSCQVCHRANCPSRKAPFDEAIWRITQGETHAGERPHRD